MHKYTEVIFPSPRNITERAQIDQQELSRSLMHSSDIELHEIVACISVTCHLDSLKLDIDRGI